MRSYHFFKYHFENTDNILDRKIKTLHFLTYRHDKKLIVVLDTPLQMKHSTKNEVFIKDFFSKWPNSQFPAVITVNKKSLWIITIRITVNKKLNGNVMN